MAKTIRSEIQAGIKEVRAILNRVQEAVAEIRDTMAKNEAAGQPVAPKDSIEKKIKRVLKQ